MPLPSDHIDIPAADAAGRFAPVAAAIARFRRGWLLGVTADQWPAVRAQLDAAAGNEYAAVMLGTFSVLVFSTHPAAVSHVAEVHPAKLAETARGAVAAGPRRIELSPALADLFAR